MASLATAPLHIEQTMMAHDLMIELGRLEMQIERFRGSHLALERQPLLERLVSERNRIETHLSQLMR